MVLRWNIWEEIHHGGGALTNGISALHTYIWPESACFPFHCVKMKSEITFCEAETSPVTESAGLPRLLNCEQ
jgi:hypothetical protein